MIKRKSPVESATSKIPAAPLLPQPNNPAVPLQPVAERIGERPGNLKARARAFAKRSGGLSG